MDEKPKVIDYWGLQEFAPPADEQCYAIQKKKYLTLHNRGLKNNQKALLKYPKFKSFSDFEQAQVSVGFVTGLVLKKKVKENLKKESIDYTFIVSDPSDLASISYSKKKELTKPSLEEPEKIITGLHVGFIVAKITEKIRDYDEQNNLRTTLKEPLKKYNYRLINFFFVNTSNEPWPKAQSKVIILSDVHCGSTLFMKSELLRLIDIINQDQRIKYVLLIGDVVDGNSVYPAHWKDLELLDLKEQYQQLGQYLSLLRKDIQIIISPGNHDWARKVEPQRFVEEAQQILKRYISPILVSNPAYLSIEGVYFYLNHGTGIPRVVSELQNFYKMDQIIQIIKFLTIAGNFSPIRKGGPPVLETSVLAHIIPEKVNIVACGHTHNQGHLFYNQKLLISTGAWQGLTKYMKLLGVKPSLACGFCIDLKDPKNTIQIRGSL